MKMKKKKHKIKKQILLFLFLFVFSICSFSIVQAKYVHQAFNEQKGYSKSFYFTSDYLKEQDETYYLSENTTELSIELRNYEDEFRHADSSIAYIYSVYKNGEPVIDSFQGKIDTKDGNGNKSIIQIKNMEEGNYKVLVEAIKPFHKVLQGTFVIPSKDSNLFYEVSDSSGSPYVLLTVYTKAYEGDIKITWPENVIPDSTQAEFSNSVTWNNSTYSSGTITTNVKPYSSYTYLFFKNEIEHLYDESAITAQKMQ